MQSALVLLALATAAAELNSELGPFPAPMLLPAPPPTLALPSTDAAAVAS